LKEDFRRNNAQATNKAKEIVPVIYNFNDKNNLLAITSGIRLYEFIAKEYGIRSELIYLILRGKALKEKFIILKEYGKNFFKYTIRESGSKKFFKVILPLQFSFNACININGLFNQI
jgi:hypothetical protein